MGLASVFSSLSSNVPVEFSQQEIILSSVWTVARCLQETKNTKKCKGEKLNPLDSTEGLCHFKIQDRRTLSFAQQNKHGLR